MSVPKSVIRLNKNGVKYVSDVEKGKYFIHELSRAALRDVAKFVKKKFRDAYYSHFKRITGDAGRVTKSTVYSSKSTTNPRVEIGIKTGRVDGFYGYFQELGTSKTPRLGLLKKSVLENVAEIIKIESQYLSALENEAKALALIGENDYEGDDDE